MLKACHPKHRFCFLLPQLVGTHTHSPVCCPGLQPDSHILRIHPENRARAPAAAPGYTGQDLGWPSSSSNTPQGTSGCWGRESRACSKGLSSCEGNTPVHTHAQPLTPAHSRARVRTPLSAASLLASSVPSRSLHARFRPWLPLNPN